LPYTRSYTRGAAGTKPGRVSFEVLGDRRDPGDDHLAAVVRPAELDQAPERVRQRQEQEGPADSAPCRPEQLRVLHVLEDRQHVLVRLDHALRRPVVPDVYVYVATSIALDSAARLSRSPLRLGQREPARAPRPSARLSQSSAGASPVGSMTIDS
jgi:hypothetical protein